MFATAGLVVEIGQQVLFCGGGHPAWMQGVTSLPDSSTPGWNSREQPGVSTVLRLAPLGEPLTGHTGPVQWGAWAAVAGRPVLATGGNDGTVRLWDPSSRAPLGEPLTGHTGSVWWVSL